MRNTSWEKIQEKKIKSPFCWDITGGFFQSNHKNKRIGPRFEIFLADKKLKVLHIISEYVLFGKANVVESSLQALKLA